MRDPVKAVRGTDPPKMRYSRRYETKVAPLAGLELIANSGRLVAARREHGIDVRGACSLLCLTATQLIELEHGKRDFVDPAAWASALDYYASAAKAKARGR